MGDYQSRYTTTRHMFKGRYALAGCLGAITLLCLIVSLAAQKGFGLAAFSDVTALMLMLVATGVMLANAMRSHQQTRAFWLLMAAGLALWSTNQGLWSVFELVLRRDLPDPFAGDIILFLHVVPFMAAIALRPHRKEQGEKVFLTTLNLLMLILWWVFLYAFVVFPDEYLSLNLSIYNRSYDFLYLLENLIWLGALGLVAAGTRGQWKKIYWHMLGAGAVYATGSSLMNAAISRGKYYSGSIFDVLYVISLCWFIWIGFWALDLKAEPETVAEKDSRLLELAPRLAMVAILSLPLLGFWALMFDHSPPRIRQFRLLAALAAMLVLGVFVFIKQFLLDRQLVRLLDETYRSFDNLQRLQTQVVQKEKLASLGQLVAGAAHEINNPVAAILGYSELLSSSKALAPEQVAMVQKIGLQARRTRELVTDRLSFAQQTPKEMSPVDVGSLLQRAVQMETLRPGENIRVETNIESGLPRIMGNANQLFQACMQIISNAMDALVEAGGGLLSVTARVEAGEIVMEFSDTGHGMREPAKVFDPFYTTKPVGKGTGLGLSATYGVVQNHNGQITCQNKPDGGALFIIRLPIVSQRLASAGAGI